MYIRVVHHWCKDKRRDDAIAHMTKVGVITAKAPGFVYRQMLESIDDASLLTTVTAWESEGVCEAFRATRPPSDPNDETSPFQRLAHEGFTVLSTTGDEPTS
jgi:heme-degrading monooxygenase HmoA